MLFERFMVVSCVVLGLVALVALIVCWGPCG